MGQFLTAVVLIVFVFGLVYFAYQSNAFDALFGAETGIFSPLTEGLFKLAGTKNTTPSVYAGKIEISFVSLGSATEQYNRFVIKAVKATSPVIVSGWKIETSLESEVIPRAIDVYGPEARRSLQNIVLNKGDEIHVFTPFSSQNARVSGSEWRIFYKDRILSYPHGTITLRDTEGRIVDTYTY